LQNCGRILAPVKVVNPFAELLKLPSEVLKPRRSNAHYLALIEVITFYHQYQREQKADESTGELYIETTAEDIQAGNKLLKEILLRKSDELTGACRNYFESLKMYLLQEKKQVFTANEVRNKLRIAGTTFRRYQNELLGCGYVRIRGGKQATGYQYEIVIYQEYENLQASIATVLDQVYQRVVESQDRRAAAPLVSHEGNGAPKKQKANKKDPVSQ
jgi:hypothetical protein